MRQSSIVVRYSRTGRSASSWKAKRWFSRLCQLPWAQAKWWKIVWSGNTTITNCRYPWHHEEEPHNNHKTPGRQTKKSNQLSLLHQDDCKTRTDTKKHTTKQLQNPTTGATINKNFNNNKTTALEQTAAKANEGLNASHWHQILTLDSAVVEAQKMFSSHGGFLTIAINHLRETI